ncbi:phytanoyl-CoA dioxygenase family protein [Halosolutus halophilus]|uniref:phytanoyl-CoA dioxygenase family protein n=1 Tax=Halosolutus halophilus TaxID=1552990 RepID=UPI0022351C1D|nr:phytanoyl-CoA dioxygenase family protein [Halosolutus halophilus]
MTEDVLTREQRDRFVHNGFVVLRNAIPQALLDEALAVATKTVPEDLNDFEEMAAGPEDRHYWNTLDDMAPFRPLNDHLQEYAEEFVGTGGLVSPDEFAQIAVRYPTGEFSSTPDHPMTTTHGNPHVDIFDESGELQPFTIAATTYLEDVHPRGGGLTVWPGTHWRIAEYLSEHSLETFSNEAVKQVLDSGASPFEVSGPAGTVVLWHNLLVHTGGCNLGRQPRIASFTRFRRHDEEETSQNAARNPFEYWDGVEK